MVKNLLLHCCCAPCAGGCVDRLLVSGRHVTLFFSNSNIDTEEEFNRRLASIQKLARLFSLPLVVDAYNHTTWLQHVSSLSGYANFPERGPRCALCFDYSLGRAASYAQEQGMNFTTTLTVSPHKNSQLIFQVGKKWSNFEAIDFKKQDGFLYSRLIARQCGFYLQDYCGCEFGKAAQEMKKC